MRKLLAITLALGLLLSIGLSTPAMAGNNNNGVDTTLTVAPAEGQAPIIKAVWQTPDHDLEIPGTQVHPPLAYGESVMITFWAVVTHPVALDHIAGVGLDWYYPEDIYPWCGALKYQLALEKIEKFGPGGGLEAFVNAWEDGTITAVNEDLYDGKTDQQIYDDIWNQLDQCESEVWMVQKEISYHQPAGVYDVVYKAATRLGGPVSMLEDTLEYVAISGIEIDFTVINYGNVPPCSWIQVSGDTDFGSNKPSVRNIGNVPVRITVEQSNLFDEDGKELPLTNGEWSVEYGARLGSSGQMYPRQEYDPEVEVTLSKILPVCTTDKLDFWVHIKKLFIPTGTWTGDMTIGHVAVPFDDCRDPVD